MNLLSEVAELEQNILNPVNLEVHPFSIGWYNELVGPKFAIDLPAATVGLVVISGPEVFEKCVIPYLKSQVGQSSAFSTTDPLDESMKHLFRVFAQELEARGYKTETLHDFDLFPNRRPKVLVQTAAHVAGAVEYFLQNRLTADSTRSKLFGVAVHPNYGGWFAIRGIVIIRNIQQDLEQLPPLNLLQDEEQIYFLLEQFTYNWKGNLWRDVIRSKGDLKYSSDFIEYLETDPDQRWQFIESKGYLSSV